MGQIVVFSFGKVYFAAKICLNKDYKKFQYNLIKKDGRAEDYAGSLQWLEDAGMIHRCYNVKATGLPMEGNAIESTFKVYITDIGLLTTMLGGSTRNDIIQGNLGCFKGAIFENLMADTLHKKEQALYYNRKESGMELDFLIKEYTPDFYKKFRSMVTNFATFSWQKKIQ